jgi:hypothetical protein
MCFTLAAARAPVHGMGGEERARFPYSRIGEKGARSARVNPLS